MKKKNANTKKNSFFQFYLLYTIRLERRHIRRGGGGPAPPELPKFLLIIWQNIALKCIICPSTQKPKNFSIYWEQPTTTWFRIQQP